MNNNISLERGRCHTPIFKVTKNEELTHHGILGQKWGIRRYQNKDGSLTKAGMRRYGSLDNLKKVQEAEKKAKSDAAKAKYKARTDADISKIRKKYKLDQGSDETSNKKSKKLSEMTDDEIRSKINRVKLENELNSLIPKQINKGEKFKKELNDIGVSALRSAGKLGIEAAEKYIRDALGIKDKEGISKKLAQEATDLQNRVKIMNARRRLEEDENRRRQQESNSNQSNNSNSNSNSNSNQSNNVRTTYPNSENSGNSNSNQSNNRQTSSSSSNSNSENTGNSNSNQSNNRQTSNSNSGSSQSNRDAEYESNVFGEGTSSRTYAERHSRNTNDFVDVDYTEVVENYPSIINRGENYIQAFLRDPDDDD